MRYLLSLVTLYRLLPALLTALVLVQFELVYSALAILILYLINKLPSNSEDFARFEHKLDSLAKELLTDSKITQNYTRLHKTAWDHEFPMETNDQIVSDSKKRYDLFAIADIISEILWLIYLGCWIYAFLFN